MPKEEVPLKRLEAYLPDQCFEAVQYYLVHYKVHLTITRKRETVLGDYRLPFAGKNHRISVNGNLNKYSFLITLLHELAHLFAFEKYGRRISPHGKEWKQVFSAVLRQFLEKKVFPADIESALLHSIHSPAASSCGDEKLLRVLRNYDAPKKGHLLVEQLADGSLFSIKGGRVFRKLEKVRTRYKCIEISNRKLFLFSGLYEVMPVET
jgi:hypothetical protein